MKLNDMTEKHICADNIKRCFFILALMWSGCILFLLCWGLWMELQNNHVTALTEAQVHSWRWAISLGSVWLLVLLSLGLGVRRVAGNVTALKQMSTLLVHNEQESFQRKALFEAIYNAITDAVVFADKHNRIVMTNPAFTVLTGYTLEEVKGGSADFLIVRPEAYPGPTGACSQAAGEIECRRKDGSVIPAEMLAAPVRDSGGEIIGYLLVMRDITRRKTAEKEHQKLEAKLRQSCKMEAIGTLAGGIAHDFNNILGIILVNTDMALEDIPAENPARTNIERIVQAAIRARNLVKQILAYSRQAGQQLIPLMPGSLVKESLQFLRSTTPVSISVVSNINDGFRTILMDPAQFREMLVNLYSNALRAMHDRGTIEVTGTIVELDEQSNEPGLQDIKPGRYFRLRVNDTGDGMDRATQERIFDPFYTTREVGEGSGMGLAAVMGIVRTHGGHITVDSEPGAGTTVQVFFPVGALAEGWRESEASLQGTERILFVDDEQMLTEMASMFLRRQGFRVTEKTASREALAAFRAEPDAFDIVITDQTMPEMTGSELAAAMLAIRPDIPVILLSGYSKKISGEEVTGLGISEFLYKPFDGKTLVRSIRQVLDG